MKMKKNRFSLKKLNFYSFFIFQNIFFQIWLIFHNCYSFFNFFNYLYFSEDRMRPTFSYYLIEIKGTENSESLNPPASDRLTPHTPVAQKIADQR